MPISLLPYHRSLTVAAQVIVMLCLGVPSTSSAQDVRSSENSAPALIARERQVLLEPVGIGRRCRPNGNADEIIVCAKTPEAPPPREPFDPDARSNLKFTPPKGAVGVGATVRGCFLQRCPKPLVFIDVKALPPAPAGSEADLIARGEMPDR